MTRNDHGLTHEELAALATYYGTEGTMEYDSEVLRLVEEVERLKKAARRICRPPIR